MSNKKNQKKLADRKDLNEVQQLTGIGGIINRSPLLKYKDAAELVEDCDYDLDQVEFQHKLCNIMRSFLLKKHDTLCFRLRRIANSSKCWIFSFTNS